MSNPDASSSRSLDALTPPERFARARFSTYDAQQPSQERALDAVKRFVRTRRAAPSAKDSIKERIKAKVDRLLHPDDDEPQGLYLVGPVGTGKTHLLAAAHHALHPKVPCAFMHSGTLFRMTERPEALAEALAERYDVLCLDEVEIDDPANEVRLVRILQMIEAEGVQLLATSNVEPEQFLSNQMGPDRFHRFLKEGFQARYRIVFVGGDDYRRGQDTVTRAGRAWIGPLDDADAAMRAAYEADTGEAHWLTFADLRTATTNTAHDTLMAELTDYDSLYIAAITIHDTDDALRLLRVIDDLYLDEDAPALYFTADAPPEDWFNPDAHAGLAKGIAEKFTRTVSRLYAMCTVEHVDPAPEEGRA